MNDIKYCTFCGEMTLVVDVRGREDGIWRRRRCPKCGDVFNTLEKKIPDPKKHRNIVTQADGLIRMIREELLRENGQIINHNSGI